MSGSQQLIWFGALQWCCVSYSDIVFYVRLWGLVIQVVRSGDLISYSAEEGIRILAEGKFLVSDSFPGNGRNKYCLASKVQGLLQISHMASFPCEWGPGFIYWLTVTYMLLICFLPTRRFPLA